MRQTRQASVARLARWARQRSPRRRSPAARRGIDGGQRLRVQAAHSSATALGVSRVEPIATNTPADLEAALETIARQLPDGLVDANPDSLYGTSRARLGNSALLHQLLDFLVKYRLPYMCIAAVARAGGLMAYGDDTAAGARRSPALRDRILKGSNPSGVPVELTADGFQARHQFERSRSARNSDRAVGRRERDESDQVRRPVLPRNAFTPDVNS